MNSAVVIGSLVGAAVALIITSSITRAVVKRWPRYGGKWGINLNPVKCPQCGTEQTRGFRWPTSWRQAMWGGWTCKNCRCEMDKYGNRIT
jgi:hypothetical protein